MRLPYPVPGVPGCGGPAALVFMLHTKGWKPWVAGNIYKTFRRLLIYKILAEHEGQPRMTARQFYSLALFRIIAAVIGVVALACSSFAQQTEDVAATTAPALAPAASVEHPPDNALAPVDHRILGVLPNYRTANPLDVYEPLTA